ncbi:PD-(D/E)XK nuclease family protein [Peptoniphilus equinus]|uniref:PD-(D/E)XK nuclease family protein n=1 Tax=Peptoniphilus equinus TaxID=3016343 RepID=A0ABY7QSX6_9FIRM|nr:PD-(D/E)XK nuclease family protein [Peptoniphilus equinus]WBW49571.1 PD-(D/E)XK nuclease family protein [Peptoniphilus equinus]
MKIYKTSGDGRQLADLLRSHNQGRVTVAVPTIAGAKAMKNRMIRQMGGLSNVTFTGLSSLQKRPETISQAFKNYLVYTVLKDTSTEVLFLQQAIAAAVTEVIDLAKRSLVPPEPFLNHRDALLRDVGRIYSAYEEKLRTYHLKDENDAFDPKAFDTVILYGYANLSPLDIQFLAKLDRECDIHVVLPFYTEAACYADKLSERLQAQGGQVVVHEWAPATTVVAMLVPAEMGKQIKVSYECGHETMVVTSRDALDDMGLLMCREGITVSGLADSRLMSELKILAAYLLDKSHDHVMARSRLCYFPLGFDLHELDRLKFDAFVDLKALLVTESPRSMDAEALFETLAVLDSETVPQGTFAEYRQVLLPYLDTARRQMDAQFQALGDVSLYHRDRKALEFIDKQLLALEKYDDYFEPVEPKAYFEILFDALDRFTVPAEDNTLAVYAVDQSQMLWPDHLMVALDDGYPAYRERNFILARKSKALRVMGCDILSDEDRYALSLLYLNVLVQRAEHVSFVAVDKPSALYDAFECREVCCPVMSRDDEAVCVDSALHDTFKAQFQEEARWRSGKVELEGRALELLQELLQHRQMSVTGLEAYAKAPYDFLYLRLLGFQDNYYQDRYYMDRGIAYHNILERYFTHHRDYDDTALRELIHIEVADPVRRQIFYNNLSRYIPADLAAQGDFVPTAFEKEVVVDLGDYQLTGKVDRVDRGPKGMMIMDYKTSATPPKTEMGVTAFQIPLYMSALGAVGGRYGNIKKGSVDEYFRNTDVVGPLPRQSWSTPQFNQAMADCIHGATVLLQQMAGGVYDKFDTVDPLMKDMVRR